MALEDAVKEIQSLCTEHCGTDEVDKLEILERHGVRREATSVTDQAVNTVRSMLEAGADFDIRREMLDVTSVSSSTRQMIPSGMVTITIRGRVP